MFILEKPYVSDLLKETLNKIGLPVLENKVAREVFKDRSIFTEHRAGIR